MKHLRKFNESKDEKTVNTIKDILIEFEDRGFETKITYDTDVIYIIIDSDSLDIDIDDIYSESIFKMLFEYLENYYQLRVIRWSERGESGLGGGGTFPLSPTDQENEYETFHEVLKNRMLNRISLYFEETLLKRLENKK